MYITKSSIKTLLVSSGFWTKSYITRHVTAEGVIKRLDSKEMVVEMIKSFFHNEMDDLEVIEFANLMSEGMPTLSVAVVPQFADSEMNWLQNYSELPIASIHVENSSATEMYLLHCLLSDKHEVSVKSYKGASMLDIFRFAGLSSDNVPFIFELAGIKSPKNYESWRVPDGEQCPMSATLKHIPDVTHKVILHDGESALLLDPHGFTSIRSFSNLVSADIKDILANFNPFTDRKKSEAKLTNAEINKLADELC